jgi:chromatin segregation and condensation protein Rec8/ScpA/Scc1 (kleisin family)
MVISEEIKFPRPIRIDPYRRKKKVDPIDGLSAVARIGAFTRAWQRNREDRRNQSNASPTPEEASVRHLVQQVNTHLENQNILIHLVLIKNQDGYSLDVYDCTGNEQCSIIGDVVIDLNDLPMLLKNLQQEAGILLDTIS